MKVVLIEDEPFAADKLKRYLQKYSADIQILCTLISVDESVTWITANQEKVDLFFMDVQLVDGLSFEIFDNVKVYKPVIFTTAFDEFAIDAFKVNSIDYLLKPILFTDLSKALKKLEALRSQFFENRDINQEVKQIARQQHKKRFLVNQGNHIHSVKSEDIAFFFAEGRYAYLFTKNHKKYMIEYTLENLEALLDPKSFFRINRSFIVQINAILDVTVYSNRRLKLTLDHKLDKEIVVSREKVMDFKKWFEGN